VANAAIRSHDAEFERKAQALAFLLAVGAKHALAVVGMKEGREGGCRLRRHPRRQVQNLEIYVAAIDPPLLRLAPSVVAEPRQPLGLSQERLALADRLRGAPPLRNVAQEGGELLHAVDCRHRHGELDGKLRAVGMQRHELDPSSQEGPLAGSPGIERGPRRGAAESARG